MHFLRVEVVLQAATYFIVFTDADTIPPMIRLDNYSEVPLQFHQVRLNHVLLSQVWCLPIYQHVPGSFTRSIATS